jgi:hypothetical protein
LGVAGMLRESVLFRMVFRGNEQEKTRDEKESVEKRELRNWTHVEEPGWTGQ